jgi:FKBP-type peptidyl-prolyl cis-trans isomerase FklB
MKKSIITCLIFAACGFNYSQTFAEEISLPDNAFQEEIPQTDNTIVSTQESQNAEYHVFKKPNRIIMKAAVENYKSGIRFMNQNSMSPGVVTTKSGLQYKIIKAGNGQKPNETSTVECRYQGALVNGTVFEQSPPNKSVAIKINDLIPGLKEALTLMPTGSKWEIYIPPKLGFADIDSTPGVAPAAILVYKIELIKIVTTP